MMLYKVSDPRKHFRDEHYLESQVVRFLFQPSQRRFDIVVIYMAPTLGRYFRRLSQGGKPDEFQMPFYEYRLLSFRDVPRVSMNLGPNVPKTFAPQGATDEDWAAHERTLTTPQGRLVTSMVCKSERDGYRGTTYLDSSGEYSWTFGDLFASQKLARIVRTAETIEFWDAEQNVLIDRSNPFKEEMLKHHV